MQSFTVSTPTETMQIDAESVAEVATLAIKQRPGLSTFDLAIHACDPELETCLYPKGNERYL